MWHVVHLIARPIEVLLGLFCVVTAIFLYPSEEGKVQSKLEDFWVKLDDYRTVAISRHTEFMRQIAALESLILKRMFGNVLWSEKAMFASVCLSVASGTLVLLANHDSYPGFLQRRLYFLLLISLLCVTIISLREEWNQGWWIIALPPVLLALSYWDDAGKALLAANVSLFRVVGGAAIVMVA
jgi:hypothetical protein